MASEEPIPDDEWDTAVLEAQGDETISDSLSGFSRGSEPFRVEAQLANKIPRWSGVSGCSDRDRAISAVLPVVKKWVAETQNAHPDANAIDAGYTFSYQWKNKRDWKGRRSCKGWVSSCIAYVQFA